MIIEIFILLIVICILMYVIYQYQPSPRFSKANSLFDAENYSEATKIYNALFSKHPEAPAKLAECKLMEALKLKSINEDGAIKYLNEIIKISKTLPPKANELSYELIEARAQFEIATFAYNVSVGIKNDESKVKSLKENLHFIENVTKSGIIDDFSELRKKIINSLSESNFEIGIQNEKENKLSVAILYYVIAKDFSAQASNSKILYDAIVRIEICKIKQSSNISVESKIFKKTIGIYFGESYCATAFKDTFVKVIRNKENEELTRSCVGLLKGEILVGRNAYQLLRADPINTILSVRRLMGGAIKDKMVQDMIHSPYYKFGITGLKVGTDDAVAVVLGGKQYTPEQISSEILKKLKADAEEKLGDKITHAVITVPAYFTEKQKNATKIAAQLAGLKVQKLLAEPTAAAIAYGVDNLKAGDAQTVMIYDFGGGTFDLSILTIVDGQYMESGTGGDRWLGGDDIDRKLQEFVLEKVSTQYKIENIKSVIENLPQKKKNDFEGLFRFKIEDAKIELSSAKSAPIYIDNILEDENGDEFDIDIIITRDEFEKLLIPFIERTIELIEILLEEIDYDISMVDNILLVGGTSCIPLVKQMLSDKYGSAKIKISEKPMHAIAEGAAILSHRMRTAVEPSLEDPTNIGEIPYSTSHNYYIEDGNGKMEKIIEKQTPLPAEVCKNFKTTTNNQKIVKVCIHSDVEDGKYERQTMGFYLVEDNLPIESELTFEFKLDLDEIFYVSVFPKGKRNQSKQILLGRGMADNKALQTIDELIEKSDKELRTQEGKNAFLKFISQKIKEIEIIGVNEIEENKWHEIYYTTTEKYEEIKNTEQEGFEVFKIKEETGLQSNTIIENTSNVIYFIDSKTLDGIFKSSIEYKRDFYFRYAKILALENHFVVSEKIIKTHLNYPSPEVDKFKEYFKTRKINNVILKINEINNSLDTLYEQSFPIESVKVLYESLDKRIREIEPFIPSLSEKVKQLKPSLFNRILEHYMSHEEFIDAIILIQNFPYFYESPELLKNIGICCFRYVSQRNLSEKNYQVIISNWLTAIFCDKVILNSLEKTTWDDEYTFTLTDAIGSNYHNYNNLPGNVNYEDVSESNISIGDTQKELLLQFESLIHTNISDNALSSKVSDFYTSEKDAIQKVIAILENDILFTTPYFALKHDIQNKIIEKLENDYAQYSNEEALQVGIFYIKEKGKNQISEFASAKELETNLLKAIQEENLQILQSLVTKGNGVLIEKFDIIKESTENLVYNLFALKIKENDENEKLISLMTECISLINTNEKLKYQCSNYIADLCIAKVNNDEMDNYKALSLMKKAYLYSKENNKICKNIITLIRYNLMDIINDNTNKLNAIYQILDNIKNYRSVAFKNNSIELSKAKTDILNQLEASGVDISQINGISRIILTPEGNKLKKALSYLDILSEN